ncbi:MAG: polyamine aminopropyltransferase [Spirochaetia bacterium]|nr:polyamine aminopropyltransferase [Spirochaetia bacterium]
MENKSNNILKNYLVEPLNSDMGYYFKTSNIIYEKKTKYQNLEIFDIPMFGKILRLDGVFQTSEKDEFLYHELLAHVPGIAINGSKKALVIGGGDGGAIEELLKYPNLEKVVMVELDEDVVTASKEYIPNISNGAFDSSKLELRFEDGIKYIQNTNESFDQILLDLTDPFGPSTELYTKEFYQTVSKKLSAQGVLSLHIESPISRPEVFARIYWTLKSIFKYVTPMVNYVPMYGSLWGFAAASNNTNVTDITKETIISRLKNHNIQNLKFYNENTHFSVMAMPQYINEIIKEEKSPILSGTHLNIEKDLDTFYICK